MSTTAFHQMDPMPYLLSQTTHKNTKRRHIPGKLMQNDGSPDNQEITVSNTGTRSSQQSNFNVKGEEQNLKAAESTTGRLEVWFFIHIFKYCNYNILSTCVPKFSEKSF